MRRNVLALTIMFLLCSTAVLAATCKKYGPSGQTIYYVCHEPEKTYKLLWNIKTTRTDGKVVKKEIVHESICYNYAQGSIDYRACRNQARDHFEKMCYEMDETYRNTGSRTYAATVKIDRDCFCRSASLFNP